jgi:hypothetical protein
MITKMSPVSITLTDNRNVVFKDAENRIQTYKDVDLLDVKGDMSFLRLTDRSNNVRFLDVQFDQLTTINVQGTISTYVPVSAREKRQELARYQEFTRIAIEKLSSDVFIGSDTPGTGGGGSTTLNVLSSTDSILGTVDASVPDTVKLMDATLSYAKVGTQGQITAPPAATKKAFPIRHARPISSSFYTNDFIDLYNSGVFDFWDYTGDVELMKVGANDFVLDASTPNPFGTLDRFTATDGTGPTTPNSAEFSSFGAGETYVVCDWLHRVMWYVANLGNLNFSDSMAEVTTQNAANLKGYNDWFVTTEEILLASGYTDHSVFYYLSPNMFQRGAVSGYSEALMWTCRVAELSTANAMSFYPAYDWRRRGLTSTGQTIYLCRTIKDADIIAMGGTP